jgi:hypothetical protein
MADRTDPAHYLREIRDNVARMQAQKNVTPTENALFHMIDGLSGLFIITLESVADLKRRVDALEEPK